MPHDEDDDLYNEEFDFVDDDEDQSDDSDLGDEPDEARRDDSDLASEPETRERAGADSEGFGDADEEPVDEYGRPEPAANYVVHIYEQKKFKRTLERPFTPEDAEAFATEYNRTSKPYHRIAVSGKNDAKPKKTLD
jgi:hypothetical protein